MPKAAGVADVSHNACPATHTYSDHNLHTYYTIFQSKKMNRNSVYMHVICLARAVACIGHNTCLCRPQHLFTSASALTCVGHNTSHLHQPQHLFTSAKTLVYVGHNTSHLCQQRYWPAPAKTQVTTLACVSKDTGLRRPQQ